MAVYVDNARILFRRMRMCHMIADSLEELHSMADELGLQRRWFQNHSRFAHYDVCVSKRDLALTKGAVLITTKDMVRIIQQKEKDNG